MSLKSCSVLSIKESNDSLITNLNFVSFKKLSIFIFNSEFLKSSSSNEYFLIVSKSFFIFLGLATKPIISSLIGGLILEIYFAINSLFFVATILSIFLLQSFSLRFFHLGNVHIKYIEYSSLDSKNNVAIFVI